MKKNIFIVVISCLLLCSLCFNIAGLAKGIKSNISVAPGGSGSVADKNDNQEFGGTTVCKVDFTEEIEWENTQSTSNLNEYTSTLGKIVSERPESEYESDPLYSVEISHGDEGKITIQGFNFDATCNISMNCENFVVDDTSVFMIDFDIHNVSRGDFSISLSSLYRTESGESLSSESIDLYLYSADGNPKHVTVIVFEHNALLYIDGEYIDTFSGMIPENSYYFTGVNILLGYLCYNELQFTFDNLEINTFAKDYDGPIFDVIYASDISKNTDTVLGRKE